MFPGSCKSTELVSDWQCQWPGGGRLKQISLHKPFIPFPTTSHTTCEFEVPSTKAIFLVKQFAVRSVDYKKSSLLLAQRRCSILS